MFTRLCRLLHKHMAQRLGRKCVPCCCAHSTDLITLLHANFGVQHPQKSHYAQQPGDRRLPQQPQHTLSRRLACNQPTSLLWHWALPLPPTSLNSPLREITSSTWMHSRCPGAVLPRQGHPSPDTRQGIRQPLDGWRLCSGRSFFLQSTPDIWTRFRYPNLNLF